MEILCLLFIKKKQSYKTFSVKIKYVFCLLLTQKFKITMQIIYLKPNLTKIFMNKKFITKHVTF